MGVDIAVARFSRLSICFFFATLAAGSQALAQSAIVDYAQSDTAPEQRASEWTGFFAAGAGYLPEYDGADEYQTIPVVAGQVNKGNYYIASRGLGVVANIIDSERFNAGPMVRYRFGRDDDIDNARIARLSEVDDAIEAGGFVSYILRDNFRSGDNIEFSISALQDIAGGHEGFLADIGASYFTPLTRDFRLGLDAELQYQSEDYMDSYFSVNAIDSARSGLPTYEAESGFNAASLGMRGIYSFNRHWGLFGMLQYTRLMRDAADSPIVTQEGDDDQMLGILAVTYRF